jgi:hypothetical protein
MSTLTSADIARLSEELRRIGLTVAALEARAIAMPVADPDEVLRDVLRTLGKIKAAQSETIDLRPLPPLTDPEPLPPGAGDVIGEAASLEERTMRVFDLCGHAKGWRARPAVSNA